MTARGRFEKFTVKLPLEPIRSIEDLLRMIPELFAPPFKAEWGVFTTPAAQPYSVTFTTRFEVAPAVFCLGSIRRGKIVPPTYTAPTITIPDVNIQTIRLPVISVPKVTKTESEYYREAKKKLGDWGWTLNWARNSVAGCIAKMMHWFQQATFGPQVDKITSAINSGLRLMRDNTQSAVNQFIGDPRSPSNGSLNKALDEARIYSQNAFNAVTGFGQDAVNKAIANIYFMMGLASGYLSTPVAVENVSTGGFTVLGGKGAKFYYLAISEK